MDSNVRLRGNASVTALNGELFVPNFDELCFSETFESLASRSCDEKHLGFQVMFREGVEPLTCDECEIR